MYASINRQVCVQLPTYADNVALPAFARRMPPLQQSIDIACPPGSTAANLQQRVCCCGRVLGQTNGQIDGHHTVSQTLLRIICKKGSPYSITDRRVPEMIPVLGSQPAGDVSHKPPQPLRECYQFCCLVNRGTMGVTSLPKTVARQRRDCDFNPGPSAPQSSTLTTRLPCHPTRPICEQCQ